MILIRTSFDSLLAEGRLLGPAVDKGRPHGGALGQLDAQELFAAVAHREAGGGHRQTVGGEEGGVVGLVDGRLLDLHHLVAGDREHELGRLLGLDVLDRP